jgi:dipeptidase D
LGADNGIGVATELAILAANDIEHGPIECLFTIDEETGLTGAFALKEGFMSGDILLNLTLKMKANFSSVVPAE